MSGGTVRHIPHLRHNPIHVCAKGFGNKGKGGKVLTHKNGPIMMKWSIWVILERLQVLLFTRSSFFPTGCCVFSPNNFAYATRACDGGRDIADQTRLHGSVRCLYQTPKVVPKVFDTSGMKQFRHSPFPALPTPFLRML